MRPKLADRQYRIDTNRRGAALILAVALMFGLFGFLALSIDTGYIAQARAEMRRTADAAALAGCWEIFKEQEKGRQGEDSYPAVRHAAASMASLNPICRENPTVDSSEKSQDITIGYLKDLKSSAINGDASRPYYAVQVEVSRTPQANGEIPFFFGRIFGQGGLPMRTKATAVMAKHISGFTTPPAAGETLNLLPVALDQVTWDVLMATTQLGVGGDDNFSYNLDSGRVVPGSDGIFEVNLYPQGTGSPGNRGTVDIGGANNSTSDLSRQIVHGISKADLAALGKKLEFDPQTGSMTLNGDTGISAGVKDELASIVGQKRIIPVFSSVSGNGNNASYTIIKWVGVRIIEVHLTGSPSEKRLIVQPAPVIAPYGVISTGDTQSSNYVLSSAFLAR